jgi:hypothetical protein
MAFKTVPRQPSVPAEVEQLYDLLPKQSSAPGSLWLHQGDLLRAWQEKHDKNADRDVALELPTGAGKTLVGGLIGEWLRRKDQARVAYVCPNRLLARQVTSKLTEYGIDAVTLIDRVATWNPSDRTKYSSGKAIGVTVYSHLFNTNPAINDADLLILDDAHAAEQYVAKAWSLLVEREASPGAFLDILSVLATALDLSVVDVLRAGGDLSRGTNVHLASPLMVRGCGAQLEQVINRAATENKLTTDAVFAAKALTGRLERCMVYLTPAAILIRPLIPPTSTHPAFSSPRRRLYMSATLGAGGELERAFGRRHITRVESPAGWEKRASGRRLFVFPSISPDLRDNPGALNGWIQSVVENFGRAALLTPDNRTATSVMSAICPPGYTTFSAPEVEADLSIFTREPRAVLTLANRYDGLDLRDDDCHLLIMAGLPGRGDLQERFLSAAVGAGEVLRERVSARVVQGSGRATRGLGDWAAVIILEDDLVNYLHRNDNQQLMREELQAEIAFGIENSTDTSLADMKANLDEFRAQSAKWKVAEQDILRVREERRRVPPKSSQILQTAVEHEVKTWAAVWAGDLDSAVDSAKDVLEVLGTDRSVQRYSSLWRYLRATWLAALGDQSPAMATDLLTAARADYRAARTAAYGSTWLPSVGKPGSSDAVAEDPDGPDLAAAQELARRLANPQERQRMPESTEVHSSLKATEATAFCNGMVQLGLLLGATISEGDRGDSAAPDATWIFGDQVWVGWEAKSEQKPGTIGADDVRQTGAHLRYIAERYNSDPPAGSICVLATPRTQPGPGATAVAEPHTYVISLGMPDHLAERAIRAWRTLNSRTGGPDAATVASVLRTEQCLPSQWMPLLTTNPFVPS